MDISGILNLIQESRLLKSEGDVKPLLSPKGVFWLKEGDIVEGQVTQSLPQNRVMITINNRPLLARTDLPLNPGDQIKVEVQSTKGEIILKVLRRKLSADALIKREVKPLLGTFQRPIDKTILNLKAAIRSFFASKPLPGDEEISPLLAKLSELLDQFNINPIPLENAQETPSTAPALPGREPVLEAIANLPQEEGERGFALREWILSSGIEWENKLQKLVQVPPKDIAGAVRSLIEHDLKGLSLKIIALLSKLDGETTIQGTNASDQNLPPVISGSQEPGGGQTNVAKGAQLAEPSSSPSTAPPNPAILSELSQQLEHLSQTIQAHQWVNATIRQDTNPSFYFQIPLALTDGLKPLDLFIYKRKPPKESSFSRPDQDPQGYWVVFFLNLSVLGDLRIDLKTQEKRLTLSIQTETETAARQISPFLAGLRQALLNVGYHVSGLKVEKAPEGKVPRPDPIAKLPLISKGVISIVA